MKLYSVLLGLSMLVVLALHGGQGRSASAESGAGRTADLAAIERLHQQTIAATLSRDPVALADCWTDDAILIGGGQAEVGKQAIRAGFDRQTANRNFQGAELRSRNQGPVLSGCGGEKAWASSSSA